MDQQKEVQYLKDLLEKLRRDVLFDRGDTSKEVQQINALAWAIGKLQ
jgi:hypothetical protein